MKRTATITCALIASAILGYALGTDNAPKPSPTDAAIITSLEYDIQSLRDEVRMKAEEITKLKARPPQVVEKLVEKIIHEPVDTTELESLRVQLAEARRMQGACQPAYQPGYYVPRRGLFGRAR